MLGRFVNLQPGTTPRDIPYGEPIRQVSHGVRLDEQVAQGRCLCGTGYDATGARLSGQPAEEVVF